MVEYTYSTWGEVLSVTGTLASTVGQKNPLRYRGYYYDQETGFYHLKSRYYDPVIDRFLNADNAISGTGESVHGYNLFAYCNNNPVNMSDETGHWPKWVKKIANSVVKIVKSITKSLKINAGVGAGFGGSAKISNSADFECESYANVADIELNDGNLSLNAKLKSSIGIKFNDSKGVMAETSFSHKYFDSCNHSIVKTPIKDLATCSNAKNSINIIANLSSLKNDNNDVIIGIGFSSYYFFGYSINFEFNISKFIFLMK